MFNRAFKSVKLHELGSRSSYGNIPIYIKRPAVHQGVCSTTGDVQCTGGYHEYTGGYHEYTGGIS